MRLLGNIDKLSDSLKTDFENKKWGKLIVKILLILFVLICMGTAVAAFCWFILEHLDYIILAVGAVACIIVLFQSILPPRHNQPSQPQAEESSEIEDSILAFDTFALETTYAMLRKNLCVVVGEVSDIIKLRKPATLSQMDAPTHYDIVSQIPIYHFLFRKSEDNISTDEIFGILQTAIEQKLNNHELDGISQKHFYHKGMSYPIMMIDSVRELGSYVQIDIAIVNERYCYYREQRIYNQLEQNNSNNPYDKDF